MDIVDKLKDSYSFLGDPLHREACEEIEAIRVQLGDQLELILALENETKRLWEEVRQARFMASEWEEKYWETDQGRDEYDRRQNDEDYDRAWEKD
jgi:hypothetical protein